MGSLKKLWGYYPTGKEWKKVKVDSEGKLVLPTITTDGWISASETWTLGLDPVATRIIIISGDVRNKYSLGMKFKLTQNSTVKYFFITKLEYHAPNTWIWVYSGTNYTLEIKDIINNYYSFAKAPYGFPLEPTAWTVKVTDNITREQQNPVQNTWYNLGSISITIPIGSFIVSYIVCFGSYKATATTITAKCTLSTANNSESDSEFTCRTDMGGASDTLFLRSIGFKSKTLNLATKTIYYINTNTTTTGMGYIYNINQHQTLIIKAVCAYL
ncbi:hypothetical protein ES705_32802 [subsurface metagenome]